MKTIRSILTDLPLCLLTALLCLTLTASGCTWASFTAGSTKTAAAVSTTAQTVASINTAIPASIKADIVALIAKHPEAQKDLETVANAIESFASTGTKITNDAAFVNSILPWLAGLPGVGSFVADLHMVLSAAIAIEPLTAQGLTEIGELIKSFA